MACRLCLSLCDESITKLVKDDEWKSALRDVLPQLMLNITIDPVICEDCNSKLWLLKAFRDTCLSSERSISTCKSDPSKLESSGYVNIRKVVMKPTEKEQDIMQRGLQICRLCLQFTMDYHILSVLSPYTMSVKNLFKELDLDMTSNPVICKSCATSSEELYQFREMCTHVENTLQDNCLKGNFLTQEEFIAIAIKVHSETNTVLNEQRSIKSEPLSDNEGSKESIDIVPKVEIKQEPEEYNSVFLCENKPVKSEVCPSISNSTQANVERGNISSREVVLDLNEAETNVENYITVVQEGDNVSYKCFFCEYSSKMKRYARTHIINRHNRGTGSYECIHCSYKTVWEHMFKVHMKEEHNLGEVFQCTQCPYQARRPDVLLRHVKVKHSNCKSYKCGYCGHETKLKISLKMHIKVKHQEGVEQFACPHCEYRTKRQGDLKMHVRCQHDAASRTYRCTYCTYTTRRPSDLNIHWRAKHEGGPPAHRCPHCPYVSRSKDLLRNHMLSKHPAGDTGTPAPDWMHCYNCGYKTRVRARLRGHMRLMHARVEPLQCPHCDYTTKVKTYMNRHITWNHTGISRPYEMLREQQQRRRELQRQQQEQQPDNGDDNKGDTMAKAKAKTKASSKPTQKIHQCTQCDYRSARKSDLRTHVAARHDGTVTYQCPYCEYQARWKHSLHVHRRLKHPDVCETYSCTVVDCTYTALRRTDLSRHIRDVHNLQPEMLRCPYCQYRARTDTYISKHLAKMHAGLLAKGQSV